MTEAPWYNNQSTGGNWYDPEQQARNNARSGGGFPTWGTGNADAYNAASNLQFTFKYDPSTGTVTAENNTNGAIISNAALIGDPGNKKNPYVDSSSGTLFSANDYASDYLQRINGTGKIEELRNMFIAKGWLSGEDAKRSLTYGNIADQSLAKALSGAVTEISFRNMAIGKEGGSYLTVEEGLKNIPKIAVKVAEAGTSTLVQRETFNKEDYRKSVNDIYKEMTGRGASESELTKFVEMLKAAESKDPAKRVTTTSQDGKTSTVTESGGLSNDSIANMLEKQALKDPEAENYTKATEFMDMFLGAIGEGSSVSGEFSG